jgi:diguanylate cyclase (GGDEF)-like protein
VTVLQPRRLSSVWRHASFSVKFSAVILVAGVVIAVVPLLLAQANTRGQAAERAADKVGIAANLVQGQQESLDAFAGGIARQVAATGGLADPTALTTMLEQDGAVNQNEDVLAVFTGRSVAATRGGSSVTAADPLLVVIGTAVAGHLHIAADADGQPWLVAQAQIPLSSSVAVVARPVTARFVSSVEHNLVTATDTADVSVVRRGRLAVAATVAGMPLPAGAAVSAQVSDVLASPAVTVRPFLSGDVAIATASLGGGYTLLVTTPVDALTAGWQPILLLVALILVAMLFIVVVVQTSLQRPLRRLDRAVAALGRGDFDVPIPGGAVDELGRLAATFEAMRRQLRATIRATEARAAVATELSAAQPLETALRNVGAELRHSIEADAAIIVVTSSEMSDPFSIANGVEADDLDVLLSGDGPIGEGYRYEAAGALVLGTTPGSGEAQLGLREMCVAPLKVGGHIHGVLAAGNRARSFLPSDVDLIAATAEQVALALERYRFLAVVQRQASIDDLTDLYNHRFLVDYLGQQVALAERLNTPLSMLMLDIDHFKVLNDTHGHQAGDTALAAFAQTLLSTVRRADLAARYGGEEFCVVMSNTSGRDARTVAEKIRVAVAGLRIELPDGTLLGLTVSIGGAAFPEDTDSASELLSLADEALYSAKGGGRNRTCMSAETKQRVAGRRAPMIVVHTPVSKKSEAGASAHDQHRSAQ